MKVKKVAIVDDATAYGEGLANEVEKTLKAAGVQVVAREKTNDKATDFKAILTKMKGAGPDASSTAAWTPPAARCSSRRASSASRRCSASATARAPTTMEQARRRRRPKASSARRPACRSSAASKAFLDAYKAKYGDRSDHYAPFFYDAANILIAAMQKADSTDPAQVPAGAAEDQYKGATGTIEFDDKGDRKNAEITIFTMKDGKRRAGRRRARRQERRRSPTS